VDEILDVESGMARFMKTGTHGSSVTNKGASTPSTSGVNG